MHLESIKLLLGYILQYLVNFLIGLGNLMLTFQHLYLPFSSNLKNHNKIDQTSRRHQMLLLLLLMHQISLALFEDYQFAMLD